MESKNSCCGSKKKIEGIKCEVTNCVYHAPGNCCDAGKIEVGPGPCGCDADTLCTTFKAK